MSDDSKTVVQKELEIVTVYSSFGKDHKISVMKRILELKDTFEDKTVYLLADSDELSNLATIGVLEKVSIGFPPKDEEESLVVISAESEWTARRWRGLLFSSKVGDNVRVLYEFSLLDAEGIIPAEEDSTIVNTRKAKEIVKGLERAIKESGILDQPPLATPVDAHPSKTNEEQHDD